ncbi:MAG: hypothetical protein WAW91_02755 [Candidatus Nanoperiomorbaceae bacterium]
MVEKLKGSTVAKYWLSVVVLALMIFVGLVIVKSLSLNNRHVTEVAKTTNTTSTTKPSAPESRTTTKPSGSNNGANHQTVSTPPAKTSQTAPSGSAPSSTQPTTATTPAAPTATANQATPTTAVAATGPRETFMTLLASAALTFAGVAYWQSRKSVRQ